jgi:ankyrin repeat protein
MRVYVCQNGDTALMFSAFTGHTECVRALIEVGASVDVQNEVCDAYAINSPCFSLE